MQKKLLFTIMLFVTFTISGYAKAATKEEVISGFQTLLQSGDVDAVAVVNSYNNNHSQAAGTITNEASLNQALMAQGIELASIDWYNIRRQVCSMPANTPAYFQCLYNGVLLKRDFERDAPFCRQKAEIDYPKSLTITPFNTTQYATLDTDNKVTKTTVQHDPLTSQQLADLRQRSYWSCMGEKRWKNPDQWQDGRQ